MEHRNILVTGGSGFVGRHVVARLAALTRRVFVPTRRRERAKHLIMLPTVEVVEVDAGNPEALAALARRCDAAINLVGVLHGEQATPYGREFHSAHVEFVSRLIEVLGASGVHRLVHMSALGVRDDPSARYGSMYLRSKAEGERAVRASTLDWTIMRPSVIFGPEDRFINTFARLQRFLPVVPLARGAAKLQPVYVGDVAQAIVNALDNPETCGRSYELAGPEVFTLREIVSFAGRATGHARPIVDLPDSLGRLQARVLEAMPGEPLMSRDNFDSLGSDNVAGGSFAPELGVRPQGLSAIAGAYLVPQAERFNEARAHAGR